MAFSVERIYRVYDDGTGEFVSVSEDADGLDLVELRQCDSNGKVAARITMTIHQATLFHALIGEYLSPNTK